MEKTLEKTIQMLARHQLEIEQELLKSCVSLAVTPKEKLPSLRGAMEHLTLGMTQELAQVTRAREILETQGEAGLAEAMELMRPPESPFETVSVRPAEGYSRYLN